VPLCAGNRAEIGALCKAKARLAIPRCAPSSVPYSSHNPASQPSPGAALFPVAPHSLRITSCRADGGGPIECMRNWHRRSWRTSENPILGTDQISQALKVGLYKFFTAKNSLYKDRDSRAEQYNCDCGRSPRWSSSKFAGNFRATGDLRRKLTNVQLPPTWQEFCENMVPRWRCSYGRRPNFAETQQIAVDYYKINLG
jgi:hypothetical protein